MHRRQVKHLNSETPDERAGCVEDIICPFHDLVEGVVREQVGLVQRKIAGQGVTQSLQMCNLFFILEASHGPTHIVPLLEQLLDEFCRDVPRTQVSELSLLCVNSNIVETYIMM